MKLVLTGGPSGGKTTMAMAINRAFGEQVVMIPEAASILFGGGFRRVDYPEGIEHQQRAIYHVQVEHEEIFKHDFPTRIKVCDRGTLDGLAYWPGDEKSFFNSVGSMKSKELARYAWVIHLDTARPESYNGNANPHRKEDVALANHLNEVVKKCWDGHPQRFILPSTETFASKMAMTLAIVEKILLGLPYKQICQEVIGC